jgi:hypothetical protein
MAVRQNHNRLSDAEKTRFIAAVKRMKTNGTYDVYPAVHQFAAPSPGRLHRDDNAAHRGPAFCPWHRYFLAKFELDLKAADRELGGDGSLMLPYWDWTLDDASAPNRQRGGLWHDDFLGGAGDPVSSGPFRAGEWAIVLPASAPVGAPPHLQRALGSGPLADATALPVAADVTAALALEGFDCPPFDDENIGGDTGIVAPSAPAATGTTGGSLPAGSYRVAVTYVNAPRSGSFGETRLSPVTVVCLGSGCTPGNSNNKITVPSPPASGSANGYRVYVSPANGAAGSETLQGGTVAIGTASTVSTVTAGAARPKVNSTTSFRTVLEGWFGPGIHNIVHRWVSGSMQPGTSPNDPVFFMHHCNIDRLWALWQFRHPGENYPEAVPKIDSVGVRPHGLTNPMPPWSSASETVRPVDVLNHTSFQVLGTQVGHTYDTDPPGVAVNVSP